MTDQKQFTEEGEWFDLTPPEKKLIWYTFGLGIVLLGILIWISYTLIPIQH